MNALQPSPAAAGLLDALGSGDDDLDPAGITAANANQISASMFHDVGSPS